MTPQTVNFFELVMLTVFVICRYAASAAIVYFVVNSNITIGYQTLIICLVVIFGIGIGIKYDNPNNHKEQPVQVIEEVKN